MIRAAAKNHASVGVVVDPDDYAPVLEELRGGGLSAATRLRLAQTAFAHTAHYDSDISAYLRRQKGDGAWPEDFTLGGSKVMDLRYGENPHQSAALYRTGARPVGIAAAEQMQGIELSYNNIVDVDAAWALVQDLGPPAAVIIKHTNPCGAAQAATLSAAYARAYECDTVSAFGGVVALNQECDEETAKQITSIFVEVVVAPSYTPEALAAFAARARTRVLTVAPAPDTAVVKAVSGGFLVQSPDIDAFDRGTMRSAGKRPPTDEEWEQLLFAWRVCKHVKSNAIVLARGLAAVGVGAGQMSRVESVNIAVQRAGEQAAGSVLASDAFFPFPDGVEAAIAAGVTAIIQPGGSLKDAEVLRPADAAGVAMVYTGIRHFRH
jgi:phosphoribosylaminoimidazolecarboxamide formyltransferase/IMP cyclohydrolase